MDDDRQRALEERLATKGMLHFWRWKLEHEPSPRAAIQVWLYLAALGRLDASEA